MLIFKYSIQKMGIVMMKFDMVANGLDKNLNRCLLSLSEFAIISV